MQPLRRMPHLRMLLALVVACTASGCASTGGTVWTSHAKLPTRAVFLNRHGVGVPVRLTGDPAPVQHDTTEYNAQLHEMMNELRANRQPRGLMIVVHGGMTGFGASRKFTEEVGDSIHKDGYNPIFINWRTSFWDSYGEHLMWTRRGHVTARTEVVLNVPANLVADAGRGVSRFLLNVPESLRDEGKLIWGGDGAYPVVAEYNALRAQFGEPDQVQVSLGTYCTSTTSRTATLLRTPAAVFRLGLGLPLSDWVGTSSWNNMVRRTKNVFRQPRESSHQDVAYSDRYRPGQGGASILMDSLVRLVREDSMAGIHRPITLIGHSMGAIVLNEVIRLYAAMDFDTIVYMASAASARDVYENVLPYLATHRNTRFYNLTLHPNADAREHMFSPVVPVGSLLEAIDDIYENPATHVDRTFGKWTNVMETLHLIPDSIRGQITIKGFGWNDPNHPGYGARTGDPGVHGDFNEADLAFWRRSFWEATPPPRPDDPQLRGCRAP